MNQSQGRTSLNPKISFFDYTHLESSGGGSGAGGAGGSGSSGSALFVGGGRAGGSITALLGLLAGVFIATSSKSAKDAGVRGDGMGMPLLTGAGSALALVDLHGVDAVDDRG